MSNAVFRDYDWRFAGLVRDLGRKSANDCSWRTSCRTRAAIFRRVS